MNEIKLSQRLQMVADFVPQGARLADIGSDHAFLPSYLVQQGVIDFAVAGEVVEGPYQIAQNHVHEASLHNNIYVRLADGLAAIEPEDQIDTIVIAGMGGILISEILGADLSKLASVKRLILQPNNHEPVLRQWLAEHDFVITDEQILQEAGKFYEIIVAAPADGELSELTEKELTFGPKLLSTKSDIFQKKWQKELNTVNKILARLPEERADKRAEVLAKKAEIEEVLRG